MMPSDQMPNLPPRHLVIYDDMCPMCTFQSKIITWCDWFNAVKLVPMSQAESVLEDLVTEEPISREQLMAALHVVTKKGRVHRGARAFRFMGLRMPLFFPLSVLLWLPGVIYLGEWVYNRIANNRYIISRVSGCKTACAITPAKPREDEDVKLADTQAGVESLTDSPSAK